MGVNLKQGSGYMVIGKTDKIKKRSRFSLDDLELSLISLPTFILYVAFCYLPMFGIIIAFKYYKPKPGAGFLQSLFVHSKWVGLENVEYLFKSVQARIMFTNTVSYNIVFIILGVLIPVTLAILISQLYSKKLAKACQTSMFLPHFLSWVVVSYFIYAFLSTDKGLVNSISAKLGVGEGYTHNWYLNQNAWRYLLVFAQVWKTMGYNMVVYMASLSGIDGTLYEAALIDGASKWQQVKYVTIPLLRPMISIMFILAIGNIFRSDFGLFYQATRNSGAIADVTTTIDVYVFKYLAERGSNINISSAAALVQSVFGFVTILAANLIVKKIDPEAGLF
jgi:putative aldouronate transport system permease protein